MDKKVIGGIAGGIGLLLLVAGLFIVTGYDKKLETWVLDQGYSGQQLLKRAGNSTTNEATKEISTTTPSIKVPRALLQQFPYTDFSKADQRLEAAISGGPSKDGIPAIDEPTFMPLANYNRPDSIQAIVLVGENVTKVYPYNILTWHEIVNDEIDGRPVAVTFCPLCGSAIVFNRTLPNGSISTFGVSGSLLESNMIMYDRATENLWQQSTGKTLAGSFHSAELVLEPFQLLTLGEVRSQYPQAVVLSEDTGHFRDYGRNPYAGYENDDSFVFEPTTIDTSFPPKTIMAVFRSGETTFATPWLELRKTGRATVTEASTTYTLQASDSGEVSIVDAAGTLYPFYFEMWFSVAVQHRNALRIVRP